MIKILASFTSFLILTSCFSLLTSQGPETLPEGKMETGVTSVLIRGAGGNVEFSHGWFEPYFRFGLSSRTDLGIRGLVIIDMGKPIQNFIMVELKHQLNKKAPFFSTGIGALTSVIMLTLLFVFIQQYGSVIPNFMAVHDSCSFHRKRIRST